MRLASIGKQNNLQHGHTAKRNFSRAYRSWTAMRRRCEKPGASNYKWYGGRGIRVCERWASFPAFLADMGDAPEGATIDRIDPNGHYEPGNCRWVVGMKAQGRNRRANRVLEYRGESRCVAEWAEVLGVSPRLIVQRLSRNWSVERALGTEKMR
jgi:hypothetical protein